MDILENINELGNKLFDNFNLKNIQENFLKTNIGQIANTAINVGLKKILPDFIEDEVIEVKDALISGGIKEGINTAIDNAIELGKKALGIDNNEFKSIEEAQQTLEKGELASKISENIDKALENTKDSNTLSNDVATSINNGKDAILEDINTNIEKEFSSEMKALEKIEKYINNWEKCYSKKDLEGLKKEYNKIQKQMKNILPLEKIIKNINKIENINELINNTENFDFSSVYLDLAENL